MHLHNSKRIMPNQLPTVQIARRVKRFYKAWEVLTGDPNILATLKGYQFLFLCQLD